MLIAGALVFNYVVTIENIPASLARFMAGLRPLAADVPAASSTSSCWSSAACSKAARSCWSIVPIFIPTAKALGIDLVHFGVVVVVNIMIGLLTPPYGLLLFVLANMTKQPLRRDRARSDAVHLMAILVLAIITVVPDSILWLPRLWATKAEICKMKPIYVLNGPNLNRLGKREPEIYGNDDPGRGRSDSAATRRGDHPIEFRQSNSEAEMIDWIHEAIEQRAGIIINPAAFTFTSMRSSMR